MKRTLIQYSGGFTIFFALFMTGVVLANAIAFGTGVVESVEPLAEVAKYLLPTMAVPWAISVAAFEQLGD